MAIFGNSEFISVFLGKIIGKNLEWLFQIYTSLFGENGWEKFRMAILDRSEFFLTIFLYMWHCASLGHVPA